MLTLDDLKDKNLKFLISGFLYTQVNAEYKIEHGDEQEKNDAIEEALESEHDLVNYINKMKLD